MVAIQNWYLERTKAISLSSSRLLCRSQSNLQCIKNYLVTLETSSRTSGAIFRGHLNMDAS